MSPARAGDRIRGTMHEVRELARRKKCGADIEDAVWQYVSHARSTRYIPPGGLGLSKSQRGSRRLRNGQPAWPQPNGEEGAEVPADASIWSTSRQVGIDYPTVALAKLVERDAFEPGGSSDSCSSSGIDVVELSVGGGPRVPRPRRSNGGETALGAERTARACTWAGCW